MQFKERPCQCQELSFGTVNEIISVSSNQLSTEDVNSAPLTQSKVKKPEILPGQNVKIQVKDHLFVLLYEI